MIGEIPGCKAGVMIDDKYFFDGLLRLDVAVRAGKPPHSVEDPANGQVWKSTRTDPCLIKAFLFRQQRRWSFLSP